MTWIESHIPGCSVIMKMAHLRTSVYQVQCILFAYTDEHPSIPPSLPGKPDWNFEVLQVSELHARKATGSGFVSWAVKFVESYYLNLCRFSNFTPRMYKSKLNRTEYALLQEDKRCIDILERYPSKIVSALTSTSFICLKKCL